MVMTFPLGKNGSAYNPQNFRKLTWEFVSLVMGVPFKSNQSNDLWNAKGWMRRQKSMNLICRMIIATLAHEGYKPDVRKGHGYLRSENDQEVLLAQKEILNSISSFLSDPKTFADRIKDAQYEQLVMDYFAYIIKLNVDYEDRRARE